MSKKVLIVTEEWAGSGHWMAAVAIQEALVERAEKTDVSIIGGLGEISPLLREVSRFSYATSIRYFPRLWQKMYDREKMWSSMITKPLGKLLGKRMLRQVIEKELPDTVVATHAYCLPALTEAKTCASKPFTLVNVLTDFHVNHFWVAPQVDAYVVAHDHVGKQLRTKHGIPAEKIFVYGIPVRPTFAKQASQKKQERRVQLGLDPLLYTVLIGGGAGGYGGIAPVVNRLLQTELPLQMIVVTGKNEKLYEYLSVRVRDVSHTHSIHLLGYVENIWEWIGASDVYITKAGGLSCSEALAMKIPLILYRPLPGQEHFNSRFLCEQKVAVEAKSVSEITQMLLHWRDAREREKVTERMQRLGCPDSSYRTAEMILQL